MRRLRFSHVGISLAAAAVAGVLAVYGRVGWLEWFFATVMLTTLGLVVHHGVRAWRHAVVERQRMVRVSSAEPGALARTAVREERRRLSQDIVDCLRQTLLAVEAEAATTLIATDPVPGIQRIRRHTQLATTELRRQLGLLRAAESGSADAAPALTGDRNIRLVQRADLTLAVLAVLLAGIESLVYPRMDGAELSWMSALLTVTAAGTIIGRTVAPGTAAFACGALFLVGVPLGAPVEGGFWVLITVGGLLWTVGSRAGTSFWDLAGGVFLAIGSTTHIWLLSSDNITMWLLIIGVSTCGGLVVRFAHRVAGSARARADGRETELHLAAASAVNAERRSFARELHDVVSHAVGLIAVQSGAAEVAWPVDPRGTRESLRVIGATASGALAELNRLSPDRSATTRSVRDLYALVERIRSAGTSVELNVDLDTEAVLAPEVFRTVQEALTNVVRHAPGASARVAITGTVEETLVVVVDDGPTDTPSPQRGYGLVGLAERVSLAGGVLEAGPGQDGRGFRVAASLPNKIGLVR
jgi:signal transduction histidine kinase